MQSTHGTQTPYPQDPSTQTPFANAPGKEELEKLDQVIRQKNYAKPVSDDDDNAESGRFAANYALVRERAKVIIQELNDEFGDSDITEEMNSTVRQKARTKCNEDPAPLTMMEKGMLLQAVLDEIFGFGPLGPVLRDPTVGNICINAVDSIFVERYGRLEKTTVAFDDLNHFRSTIDKITIPLGRRFNENCPIVNARLPNGSRINATMSVDGPTMTIRCFGITMLSLAQMVEQNCLSISSAAFLKACVAGRLNIVVCGASGTGKTTLLNALLKHVDDRERIISIEEKSEIRCQSDNWVRLEVEPGDANGRQRVSSAMLFNAATQMFADRIIPAEMTGPEVLDVLSKLQSGMNGSLMTLTANSPSDCVRRLEGMVRLNDAGLSMDTARQLIANSIQLIVHLEKIEDGTHRVTEISEIAGFNGERLDLSTIFRMEKFGRDSRGLILGAHLPSGRAPLCVEQLERAGVPYELDWFRSTQKNR